MAKLKPHHYNAATSRTDIVAAVRALWTDVESLYCELPETPYQAMLSPACRGRGSMGCLGRWSAIKSWVNIQDLHTDERDSQTSNHDDRKPQWAQCPHYPTSQCSLADTHQQCICMMICNTQSMNAVHHQNQTLLSSEQPLPVWHSQVPEHQPRLWDWIKLAPQSNPTDTKVLGESQKQRRV